MVLSATRRADTIDGNLAQLDAAEAAPDVAVLRSRRLREVKVIMIETAQSGILQRQRIAASGNDNILTNLARV